jgi:two-component system nitrogen regulation response regulator NtrX
MKSTYSKHVLIADDDPSILTSIRATLEADGYQVTAVEDGKAAIETLLNRHFDLAILDLAMPKIDGLLVLKEFQLVRGTEATPVLILTAHGSVDAELESTRNGAIEFLHKPILPETLRVSVRQAIAREIRPPLIDHSDNYMG